MSLFALAAKHTLQANLLSTRSELYILHQREVGLVNQIKAIETLEILENTNGVHDSKHDDISEESKAEADSTLSQRSDSAE